MTAAMMAFNWKGVVCPMKLAQFKTKGSDKQRLGAFLGDVVRDVAELARAIRSTDTAVAEWLLEINSTLEVINRGSEATDQLHALLNAQGGAQRAAVTA